MSRALPYIVWLTIGLVWGTTWAVIRVGLRDLPPLTFAAARTVLAGGVLLLAARWFQANRRPHWREVRFWLMVGVPQLGVPYALIFWAQQTITSGLTAMLFATFPVSTAIVAHFLLKEEPLTATKLGGTLLAVAAVVTVVGSSGAVGAPAVAPVAAVLIAALSASFGAVMVRRHGRNTSTIWLTALQVSSGAAFLSILALALEYGMDVRVTPTAALSVVYLALVVTVGCYLGLFWVLKRLDATFVSMGVIFETVVGVFLGALALGETLGLRVFVGLALVGISIAMVNRRPATTGVAI